MRWKFGVQLKDHQDKELRGKGAMSSLICDAIGEGRHLSIAIIFPCLQSTALFGSIFLESLCELTI